MHGTCDKCGHYSRNLELEDETGDWCCRECMKALEQSVAEAVKQ